MAGASRWSRPPAGDQRRRTATSLASNRPDSVSTARPVPAVPGLAGAASARPRVDDDGCARLEVATAGGVRTVEVRSP